MHSPYMTLAEVAVYARVPLRTMRDLRYRGEGPSLAGRAGRRLLYRREDVDRWIAERGQPAPVGS